MDSLHLYQALALLRLTLACIPLGGYIHPDEYFQSAEPMGQDVFNVQAERTWDWIGAQPDMYEHEIVADHQLGNHVKTQGVSDVELISQWAQTRVAICFF
jgi:hypothetical protein